MKTISTACPNSGGRTINQAHGIGAADSWNANASVARGATLAHNSQR